MMPYDPPDMEVLREDTHRHADLCRAWTKLTVTWRFRNMEVPQIIWLLVSTPLKNMKVNWDNEIPN